MLLRIAAVMAPLAAIVALGWFYARRARPDLGGANKLVVDLCLPALVFTSLSSRPFVVAEQAPFLAAAAAVIAGSGLLAWPLARWARADPRAFLPTVMFGNVGPIGIPISLLAFGPEGLAPALLLLVLSNVLHFTLGARIMSGKADLVGLLRSPLIVATVLGLAASSLRWAPPDWLATAIKLVGDVLVPFMLLSMGARLVDIPWRAWRIGGFGGVAAPLVRLVVAGALIGALPLPPLQRGALLLFAALPPAVFNFLLADRYARTPEAVAAMVLIGHLASLVFLPVGLAFALRS
jgi:malate permease and related proteins